MENGIKPPLEIQTPLGPDSVKVPDNFVINGPLDEALPRLRKDFSAYYLKQQDRIKQARGKEYMEPQEAFEDELSFFNLVVDRVTKTVHAQPGGPTYALFDVDETIGRVFDPEETDDKVSNVMSTEEQRKKGLEDSYNRLQIRPAFSHAVNYLKREFGPEVKFGILSTKAQEGLDEYLLPMINELCPDAFEPELVMSSKDGAAERLIPDVLEKLRESKIARDPITTERSLAGFLDTSPEGRVVIQERVVDSSSEEYAEKLCDYEIKWLMMIRMLEQIRKKGITEMKEGLPHTEHLEEWAKEISPDGTLILFDDGNQQIALPDDSSLQYVHVKKRYRLPDDPSVEQLIEGRQREESLKY